VEYSHVLYIIFPLVVTPDEKAPLMVSSSPKAFRVVL